MGVKNVDVITTLRFRLSGLFSISLDTSKAKSDQSLLLSPVVWHEIIIAYTSSKIRQKSQYSNSGSFVYTYLFSQPVFSPSGFRSHSSSM